MVPVTLGRTIQPLLARLGRQGGFAHMSLSFLGTQPRADGGDGGEAAPVRQEPQEPQEARAEGVS